MTDKEIMEANAKSDPTTYAVAAMYLAKGALLACLTPENASGVGLIVRHLEVAIEKLRTSASQ
jgi:hypothetical protein